MNRQQRYVVCLSGSMRFWNAILAAAVDESLAGRIVVPPLVNMNQHDSRWSTPEQREHVKAGLDELHLQKIAMADEVLVVSPGGYVGDSTRGEIEYANYLGMPVRYTELPARPVLTAAAETTVLYPDQHITGGHATLTNADTALLRNAEAGLWWRPHTVFRPRTGADGDLWGYNNGAVVTMPVDLHHPNDNSTLTEGVEGGIGIVLAAPETPAAALREIRRWCHHHLGRDDVELDGQWELGQPENKEV